MLPTGEGERVALGGAMKARGGPEGWLTAVEALTRSALRAAAKRAIKDFWCKQVTNPYTPCSTSIVSAANSEYRYIPPYIYVNIYMYVHVNHIHVNCTHVKHIHFNHLCCTV